MTWLTQTSLPRLDFLTVTCQQCERPACLRACPVYPKAISKDPDTGVVAINEDDAGVGADRDGEDQSALHGLA